MQRLTRWLPALLFAFTLLILAWIPLQAAEAHSQPDLVPDQVLSEPAQAVELSFPDLQTLPPFDLRLIRNPEAGRMWIRFSNSILNSGQGVLELEGKRDGQTEDILVAQNIYYGEDQFVRNSLGAFEFDKSHNHWHFEGFSLYEIWSVDAEGEMLEVVASSGKVSYCVRDSDPARRAAASQPTDGESDASRLDSKSSPDMPRYLSCGWTLQGLSPGWIDTYKHNTPGQYVDISGLPDGDYLLVSTVDPDNLLLETNETNNAASLYFSLDEDQVVMGNGQVLSVQVEIKPDASNCLSVKAQARPQKFSPRVRQPVRTTPCGY
jgi:hypothetical protein